jgi:hypothetical protein
MSQKDFSYEVEHWQERLQEIDPRLLASSDGRRVLCEADPMLFALIYLTHHLKNDEGEITFGEHHFEWFELAKMWMKPSPGLREHRHAFLAPRSSGKSTFWFLILPLWWAAYGYAKFVAAFADSGTQAEIHLMSFKRELEQNELLGEDFPDLCRAGRRPRGSAEADSRNLRICKNGFAFMAKGADSSSLGMKIGQMRPDTLLLDDIEPDESNYSDFQAEKRLITIQDAILPLNERARVVLSGTVTMPGSITHQLVKHGKGYDDEELKWVEEEEFEVHHQLPILESHDGTERSVWPAKWPLEYLIKHRHTRNFKKNFENDPMAIDSEYWQPKDFTFFNPEGTQFNVLSIDGAVTTKATSDYTGISIVGWLPREKAPSDSILPDPQDNRYREITGYSGRRPGICVVKYAKAVKLKGDPLRQFVLKLLDAYPEVRAILVETNQGGELWWDTLHGMPVPIHAVNNQEKKESRAGRLLNLYQLIPTRVVHTHSHTALEEQMVAFPKAPNDDLVDSVGNAVLRFLRPEPTLTARKRTRHPR